MAERQIGHQKSSLFLSARFPSIKWRSRSVAKSACYAEHNKGQDIKDKAINFLSPVILQGAAS